MSDLEEFKLYHYNPSFIAAVAAAAMFGQTTAYHLWQLCRNKTWYFIPFVIGGIFETVGYAARVVSSKQTPNWTTMPYVIQSLLLLLAPSLLAASIYMVLGRIIRLTGGESLSPIRVTWLTKIFVFGDVLSFLMQSTGGGMLAQAKTQEKVDLGEHIITGGLICQIVFFGVFMIVTVLFHMRISRHPTSESKSGIVPWKRQLIVLYAASFLIMVRSAFRVLEYIQGQDGALLQKEIYIYIFDAALMFIAMGLFNVWHPSQITNPKGYDKFDEEHTSIAMQPAYPGYTGYSQR